jgi:cholest-4-en-3-one 26-monooxygenase
MTSTDHEIDLMDPRVFADGIPYGYFRELRGRDEPLHTLAEDGSHLWHLVRHADVVAASRDTTVFSSSPSTMTLIRQDSAGLPLIVFTDPPAHTRLRRLAKRGFTPARIQGLADLVRRIADRVVADIAAKGEFDLAVEAALRLPLEVISEFVGIPDADRARVLGWVLRTVNIGDPDFSTGRDSGMAYRELFGYLRDLAERRRSEPTDDLISTLLAARFDEESFDLDELAMFATQLMNAGGETTYCSIAGGVRALLEHPDQLALLRTDRELIPRAVEEILRWVTPVTHFARNVTVDTEIAGRAVRAGQRVVLWYTSADRDEAVFDRPDAFDVTRRPNPHVVFGAAGPHVCVGSNLARLEIRCFLEAALDHLPRLELTGPPVQAETNLMNSIKRMPVRLR